MSYSCIPGERDISPEELRLIREMHAAGRSLDDIARCVAGLAPTHSEGVDRLASLLAPKRPAPRKVWKGRR